MMKKKTFDIAGSNIEMLGSAVEKKCREAAGKKEAAWAKAGKKVGLEIWRIEKFKVKAWPKANYGKFYVGDSYIVLNTYEKKDTEALAWDLHFWLGSETTQDEAGTAAYKTVELDDFLGGGPIQHREICTKESSMFLGYFPTGVQLLEGGMESGFNHVSPTEYEPRLLHIKGRKNVRVTQVELKASSLTSGDCFILDNGLTIYQWMGKSCSLKEKTRASQYANVLDSERKGLAEIVVIDEDEKNYPEEFWDLLGGGSKADIRADAGGDEKWEAACDKRMFQLTDAGGKLEFNAIGQGSTVSLSKLDTNDVFIIDSGSEIFIWIGQGSSAAEKKSAMSHAQKYLGDYKRPAFLPLTRILEGSENSLFMTMMAGKKKRKLKKSTGGPKVEQKGQMGCYLTEEKTSNGSLFLNWSEVDLGGGALAYFKPTKSVPAFKFKTKGGKSELTRETNSNRNNYYTGWVNYVKLAKEYKSTFTYSSSQVALFTTSGTKILEMKRGTTIDLHKCEVVAAIPPKSGIFTGVKTIDRGSFLNKAQGVGAALTLPAWK